MVVAQVVNALAATTRTGLDAFRLEARVPCNRLRDRVVVVLCAACTCFDMGGHNMSMCGVGKPTIPKLSDERMPILETPTV